MSTKDRRASVYALVSPDSPQAFEKVRLTADISAYNKTPLKVGMTVSNGKFASDYVKALMTEWFIAPQNPDTTPMAGLASVSRMSLLSARRKRPITLATRDTSVSSISLWYSLLNFVSRPRLTNVLQCPMHRNLIDVSLLTTSERAWVDTYHSEVFEKVSPLLKNDPRALAWLKRECTPL